MLEVVIIFGAEYLWLIAPLAGVLYFVFATREKKKSVALFALIAFPLTYLAAKGLGLLYYNPQPFVVGEFAPLIAHATDNGFPSDHTLVVAAFASVLFSTNRKLGITLFIVALLVGVSRVQAGLHHTIDIAGAVGIALAVTGIAYYFIKRAR